MGMLPILRPHKFNWILTPDGDRAAFRAQDTKRIPRVGKVVYVHLQWDTTRTELQKWRNKCVMIDGKREIVYAVECFCIERQGKGVGVGLLIEKSST